MPIPSTDLHARVPSRPNRIGEGLRPSRTVARGWGSVGLQRGLWAPGVTGRADQSLECRDSGTVLLRFDGRSAGGGVVRSERNAAKRRRVCARE